MTEITKQTFPNQKNIVVKTDLNEGNHTLKFQTGSYLVIESNETLELTINILGDGVTTVDCQGYGDIDVSSGFDVTINKGETVVVTLNTISSYLGSSGNTVTVSTTGSTSPDLAFIYLI